MNVKIIGQQLIDGDGSYTFGQGLGCAWPSAAPGLEHWSGLGPHSPGGHLSPERVSEQDCLACGAAWFLPFLSRLKRREIVALDELEHSHLLQVQKPMIALDNEMDFLARFNAHIKSGGSPSAFLGACRIVKWDKTKQNWVQLYST